MDDSQHKHPVPLLHVPVYNAIGAHQDLSVWAVRELRNHASARWKVAQARNALAQSSDRDSGVLP